MTLAMISWGIAWTNAKIVSDYFSYTNLVFLRYLSSFIFLLPILYYRRDKFKTPSFKTSINILSISLLFYIYNISFFLGTSLGSAGLGGVFVTTTNPIIAFLIISIISRAINKYQILGIMIGGIGGCIILDIFNLGFNAFNVSGNIYFIICSITWGIITVMMTYGQKQYDSFSYIFLCYFITAIISSFLIIPSELFEFSRYESRFIINFFFVSIGAMCFGTSIYMYSTPRLGPVQTSVFIFTVPFIAMGTAYIFLNEAITSEVVLGGILAILSVYIVNLDKSTI